MSNSRRALGVGSLLLLVAGSAAAFGASRAGRDGGPRNAGPAENPRAAVDVSAPATLIGDVLIRTDAAGRLLVLVDESKSSALPDGIADRAFLLECAQPIAERIEVRLPLASVIFGGSSLFVSAPEAALVVDVAVGAGSAVGGGAGGAALRVVEPDRIVLHDAIALQSRRLGGGQSLRAVDLERVALVDETEGHGRAAEACDAGGEGSQTCSYSCSMSSVSITKTDECAVSCRDGYYACCGCNWLYNATCMCHKETISNSQVPGIRVDAL